jgi:hypothetical protein
MKSFFIILYIIYTLTELSANPLVEKRKNRFPKVSLDVIRSAENEKQVRLSPKNVFEYLLILPQKELQGIDSIDNMSYSQRLNHFQNPKIFEECSNIPSNEECIDHEFEVLDIKNGYLKYVQLNSEEIITMAIFKKTDGSKIIGITVYIGADVGRYYTHFLIYKNQKWIDVTNIVLPPLSFKLFLSNKDKKLIGEEQKNDPRSYIELLRYGTSLQYKADKLESCEGDMGDDTIGKRNKCKMILKNIFNDSIKFEWNPGKGIFTLHDKRNSIVYLSTI